MRRCLPLCLLGLVLAAPASAATLYASPTGTGAPNPCTSSMAPCSLVRAVEEIAVASNGVVNDVKVAPGDYALASPLRIRGNVWLSGQDPSGYTLRRSGGSGLVVDLASGGRLEDATVTGESTGDAIRLAAGGVSAELNDLTVVGGIDASTFTGYLATRRLQVSGTLRSAANNGFISGRFGGFEIVAGHMNFDAMEVASTVRVADGAGLTVRETLTGSVVAGSGSYISFDDGPGVRAGSRVTGDISSSGLISVLGPGTVDGSLLQHEGSSVILVDDTSGLAIGGAATLAGTVKLRLGLGDRERVEVLKAASVIGTWTPATGADFAVLREPGAVVLVPGPVNAQPPTLMLQDGRAVLTPGVWQGAGPIALAHRWQRCTGESCVDLPDTGAERALTAEDAGADLRVVETATGPRRSVQALSNRAAVPARTPGPTPVIVDPSSREKRSCLSRRKVVATLRPNLPQGLKLPKAVVGGRFTRAKLVNAKGKIVRRPKVTRRRITVDFTKLPLGSYTLVAEGRLRSGKRFKAQRTYRTCAGVKLRG